MQTAKSSITITELTMNWASCQPFGNLRLPSPQPLLTFEISAWLAANRHFTHLSARTFRGKRRIGNPGSHMTGGTFFTFFPIPGEKKRGHLPSVQYFISLY